MDVGYFISELLGQHGDVSIPGLGYFAHTRINGFYNESEGKFYPPGYSVQFDPQFIDDDTLARHIADNKSISLASSKYFTEKYVANIKQQATISEVAISNLGWFYMENFRLAFRSNNELNTDPEFFGYPAVKILKLGTQPQQIIEPVEPLPVAMVEPAAIEEPGVIVPEFESDLAQEAYLIELTGKRRRKTFFVFAGLAILLTGLFYFLYTRYDRSVFNLEETKVKAKPKTDSLAKPKNAAVIKDTNTTVIDDDTIRIVKLNSGNKIYVAEPDTLAKRIEETPVTAVDSSNQTIANGPHYEILGGSFNTIEQANAAIKVYKKYNFDARILENVPGRKRKVTLGSFATRAGAIEAKKKIIATGRIKPAEIYIQPYNVK